MVAVLCTKCSPLGLSGSNVPAGVVYDRGCTGWRLTVKFFSIRCSKMRNTRLIRNFPRFSRVTMSVHHAMTVPRSQVVTRTPEGLLSYLRATRSRLATPRCTCRTPRSFTITNPLLTIILPPSPVHHIPRRYSMFANFTYKNVSVCYRLQIILC